MIRTRAGMTVRAGVRVDMRAGSGVEVRDRAGVAVGGTLTSNPTPTSATTIALTLAPPQTQFGNCYSDDNLLDWPPPGNRSLKDR